MDVSQFTDEQLRELHLLLGRREVQEQLLRAMTQIGVGPSAQATQQLHLLQTIAQQQPAAAAAATSAAAAGAGPSNPTGVLPMAPPPVPAAVAAAVAARSAVTAPGEQSAPPSAAPGVPMVVRPVVAPVVQPAAVAPAAGPAMPTGDDLHAMVAAAVRAAIASVGPPVPVPPRAASPAAPVAVPPVAPAAPAAVPAAPAPASGPMDTDIDGDGYVPRDTLLLQCAHLVVSDGFPGSVCGQMDGAKHRVRLPEVRMWSHKDTARDPRVFLADVDMSVGYYSFAPQDALRFMISLMDNETKAQFEQVIRGHVAAGKSLQWRTLHLDFLRLTGRAYEDAADDARHQFAQGKVMQTATRTVVQYRAHFDMLRRKAGGVAHIPESMAVAFFTEGLLPTLRKRCLRTLTGKPFADVDAAFHAALQEEQSQAVVPHSDGRTTRPAAPAALVGDAQSTEFQGLRTEFATKRGARGRGRGGRGAPAHIEETPPFAGRGGPPMRGGFGRGGGPPRGGFGGRRGGFGPARGGFAPRGGGRGGWSLLPPSQRPTWHLPGQGSRGWGAAVAGGEFEMGEAADEEWGEQGWQDDEWYEEEPHAKRGRA